MKPYAESCDRNRDPILEVLSRHFSDRKSVLEVGSGTGQHAVYFAAALPHLIRQTSDVADNLPGISAWLEEARPGNTPPPIPFDVKGVWPDKTFDAVFSANTLHIMSWQEVEMLFARLPALLARDAKLAIYGPFNYEGRFTSASNASFNEWLQKRGAQMAIRDFEAVNALAEGAGLSLTEDIAMPANNRMLVWKKP
jgi:cyclopropane fatty-acyl-phospholipid synthase-like methyltransferase